MNKHQGQTVEYVVRRNGFSLSQLAKELKVNRRSLYNWFKNQFLRKSVIYNIGHVIRHDFSIEFPELFTKEDFDFHSFTKDYSHLINHQDDKYKEKYLSLLEKYNEILSDGKYDL
ncbi:hypothetical protein [Mucilaginibacter phyllosphaerae]